MFGDVVISRDGFSDFVDCICLFVWVVWCYLLYVIDVGVYEYGGGCCLVKRWRCCKIFCWLEDGLGMVVVFIELMVWRERGSWWEVDIWRIGEGEFVMCLLLVLVLLVIWVLRLLVMRLVVVVRGGWGYFGVGEEVYGDGVVGMLLWEEDVGFRRRDGWCRWR